MKKKLVSVLLVSAMAATMLAGCGDSTSDSTQAGGSTGSGDSASAEGGSVYMLNFKPETDEAWQDLAATYTEQTGTDVTVVTAASGTYDTTLVAELAKDEAPTIFTIGSAADAETYANYIYDLSSSALYDHLTDKSLSIEYDGKVAAVANCYECYGLVTNVTILDSYCQNYEGAVISSVDDIKDFDTLKAVAEDIYNNLDAVNEACGTDLTGAFATPQLDGNQNWRYSGHLTGLALYYEFKDAGCDLVAGQDTVTGKYLDNYKNVWDLYVSTCPTEAAVLDAELAQGGDEIIDGEVVFYQTGDWDYSSIAGDSEYEYTMLPIYFGVDDANEGLAVGTENYWAVNAQASDADIAATLDFLEWVITSDEGRDAITNTMGLTAPFDTFTGDYESQNGFAKMVNEYAAEGKTSVAWSFNATPSVDSWRADFIAALTEYTEKGGSWDDVKTAYVDQWSYYWNNAAE